MKRKLLIILLTITAALCIVFALPACNKNSTEQGDTEQGNTEQGGNEQGDEENITQEPTEGLVYTLSEDGQSYSVTGYEGTDTTVYIPSVYNELPVTEIGYCAFEDCTIITSITIPESIINIGEYAFVNCVSLTEIHFNATACNDLDGVGVPFRDAGINGEGITVTIGSNVTKIPGYLFCAPGEFGQPAKIINVIFEEGSKCESIGIAAFAGCNLLTSITIPNGVTTIEMGAFYRCEYLTEITLPESVTTIGEQAFGACTSIKSITIPQGVTSIEYSAFSDCTSLASVTIPNNVTSIGEEAFSGCTSLTSIIIPDKITSIGESAFIDCIKLIEVHNLSDLEITAGSSDYGMVAYYAKNVYTATEVESKLSETADGFITYADDVTGEYYLVGYSGTETDITLPDDINGHDYEIYQGAFYMCIALTDVTIPDRVTSIGIGAFSDCTSLANITISDSVTSIGDDAFYGCTSLTNITIPNSVTTIGSNAFFLCSSLVNIIIQDGVTTISSYTFAGCYLLESVTIPNSVTTIGNYAFANCDSLADITIPDSVTSIGNNAFNYCRSLTSITIPNGVTSIGSNAFNGCESLESLTVADDNPIYHSAGNCIIETESKTLIVGCQNSIIPNDGSVTTIGDRAFGNCESLTSIIIPDSVTTIGDFAFIWCYSLETVYYTGSEEEWNNINVGASNYNLLNANIIFNYQG